MNKVSEREVRRLAEVEIYTAPLCPYCAMAKSLLAGKGVAFTEIDVMADPAKRAEMIERAGGDRKVPQVFIDGRHVGGFDALDDLDAAGRLDALLGVAA